MEKNLPELIRDNENLRQVLLAQEGFMKYVTEYIINGGDDGLSLFAKYQEHILNDYRKANSWDPDAQLMSDEEFRLEALGSGKHLKKEFTYRMALEKAILELEDEEISKIVGAFYDGYLAYAWRQFFECRNPDHATDNGFYRIFMEQFQYPDGLIYRSMELAIKDHHGEAWSNDDYYDFYWIAEYYYFYFDTNRRSGRLAFDRLRRGVKEWIEGKDDKECRDLAIDMLEKVRFFSQHVYNDEARYYPPFPLEDKKWLRGLVEGLGNKHNSEVIWRFREFLFVLQEVCRIWAARLLRYHDIDLHELEKTCYSFLRPYRTKNDSFDYNYYIDHYYIGDSPNTCCVNNYNKAKELLYALHRKESEDDLADAAEEAVLSEAEKEEQYRTRTENLHRQELDEKGEGIKETPRTLPTADEAEKSKIKQKYNHFVEVTKDYNFADCPAVKCLNKDCQGRLIWKIVERSDSYGAYAIAMLCELRYDDWMGKVVRDAPGLKKLNKSEIIRHWSEALNLTNRNVTGNYNVIRKEDTRENKQLYTSHTQTMIVHEDYMELKNKSDAEKQKTTTNNMD